MISGEWRKLRGILLNVIIHTKSLAQVFISPPLKYCNNVVCSQGNRETLDTIPSQKGINVREELLKFHSTHYSSNLMCLSVLGRG